MKLIIQPKDGVSELVEAIGDAKKSVEVMIFRFGHKELERSLMDAVKRGVAVQALIAYTNRGGDKVLRGLEMRLLAAGATVARTNDDLVRYHGKYMLIDRQKLYVLGFNFTKTDIERSRSFGIMTTDAKLVQEAGKLFSADCTRQPYAAGCNLLLVSPLNSREGLADFLKGAQKQLLIFDLEVSDTQMGSILAERAEAGVEVRVIGKMKTRCPAIPTRISHPLRLHARVIVRDGEDVFLGSQSLRRLELDSRREVGILVNDAKIAGQIAKVFEKDWESAEEASAPAEKMARKVAKAVTKSMPDMAAVLEQVGDKANVGLVADPQHLEQVVKEAVKNAVRDAVQDAVNGETLT